MTGQAELTGLIVIVARNNLALTQKAVRSALSQQGSPSVLVVDNASADGTREWLASRTDVAKACGWEQTSLSACWNVALSWAFFQAGLERVLVCNNDIELRPDTHAMLSAAQAEFITCVSVDKAEQLGTPGDRAIENLLPAARPHPDFSCFMIAKTVIEKVGWFDESYFPAYAEDSDFHVRMHRAGIRAICIDLPFLHLGAQTIKNASPAEVRAIQRGADRNRERFKAKYGCLPGGPGYAELFQEKT